MHGIHHVSKQTGLTPDIIRIWERRYKVIQPQRTASNQRLYDESDIQRLILLRKVTDTGKRISTVAQLSDTQLRAMLASGNVQTGPGYQWRTRALEAISNLNSRDLNNSLQSCLVELGSIATLQRCIAPLLEDIGQLWRSGSVRTCQEHFASAQIRTFLGRLLQEANPKSDGPKMVAATLPGELHELGALMASIIAAQEGWNIVYLGSMVPTEEILFAAHTIRADIVAISLPPNTPKADTRIHFNALCEGLDEQTKLIAGGAVVKDYTGYFAEKGILCAESLETIPQLLRQCVNY